MGFVVTMTEDGIECDWDDYQRAWWAYEQNGQRQIWGAEDAARFVARCLLFGPPSDSPWFLDEDVVQHATGAPQC